MGWWGIGGENDELIGDDSADAVAKGMATLKENRRAMGEKPLSAQEFVDSLATALTSGHHFVSHGIRARLSDGRSIESSGSPIKDVDAGMRHILESISAVYDDAFHREPTLREVLESFVFVLGHMPERYLSGMERISIQEIVAT